MYILMACQQQVAELDAFCICVDLFKDKREEKQQEKKSRRENGWRERGWRRGRNGRDEKEDWRMVPVGC